MIIRRINPLISILVPYRDSGCPYRNASWNWLKRYWSVELPEAEIIEQDGGGKVFSKTEAVNTAASKARGRVFVMMDADCLAYGTPLLIAAHTIDQLQSRNKRRLWFVPYRRLHRLTLDETWRILDTDPTRIPYIPTNPPQDGAVVAPDGAQYGHHYGAMIQMMHREAFWGVGGMDERFAGWGSEDVSFLRQMDTLWCRHKTLNAAVWHLWHPTRKGSAGSNIVRLWDGQENPNSNGNLANRYHRATYNVEKMTLLKDEARQYRDRFDVRWSKWVRKVL